MTPGDQQATPVGVRTDPLGERATAVFKLLGDETRLHILVALWEAIDPFAETGELSFSGLYDRVEYDTPRNVYVSPHQAL
jgi:DNA-binding transcriptional ArsR family regulator